MSASGLPLHYDAPSTDSLGAVSEGRVAAQLGSECHAVRFRGHGRPADELCASLGRYGARRVFPWQVPEGSRSRSRRMAKIIGHRPRIAVRTASSGLEIGAVLTARLDAGVA